KMDNYFPVRRVIVPDSNKAIVVTLTKREAAAAPDAAPPETLDAGLAIAPPDASSHGGRKKTKTSLGGASAHGHGSGTSPHGHGTIAPGGQPPVGNKPEPGSSPNGNGGEGGEDTGDPDVTIIRPRL